MLEIETCKIFEVKNEARSLINCLGSSHTQGNFLVPLL